METGPRPLSPGEAIGEPHGKNRHQKYMLAPGFQFIEPCLSEPVLSQNPVMDASPRPS